MSIVVKDRTPPPNWSQFRRHARTGALTPLYAIAWAVDWTAYRLGRWPLVELLEYLGSFSILFAAIVYFAGASDRLKQKHYQAWQVINTAEGRGGNGGRIDALQELNRDRVPLIGVDVSGAYLQGLQLEKAQARRANFSGADLRDADFQGAGLPDANLHYANLRGANLRNCNLAGSNLEDADMVGADLSGADLTDVNLHQVDLRDAKLDRVRNWQAVKSWAQANVSGVRNAPQGFVEWVIKNGAVVEAKAN